MAHQNNGIKTIIVIFFLILIVWDVFTTYYGTLSILDETNYPKGFFELIEIAPLFNQAFSVLFAFAIVIIIFCYKPILARNNQLLKPLLIACFIYDFVTSIIGTSSASGLSDTNYMGWAIIIFFSIIATSSPIFISRVINNKEAL